MDYIGPKCDFYKDKQISYQKLKDYYQNKRRYCGTGSRGKVYSLRQDKLINLNCDQYSCAKCRPKKKKELLLNTQRAVYTYDLSQHFIITFPGLEARKKFTYAQSYDILSHEWHKLLKVIQYHFPDFRYIQFPRAQSNPTKGNPIGYCHLHTLCNLPVHNSPQLERRNYKEEKYYNEPLNKQWIDEKIKQYQMGYTYIKEGKDVAEYLASDFTKDDEWVIPLNKKHYRATQSICVNINQGKASDPANIYFTDKADLNTIEQEIMQQYQRVLPYEEYVKYFYATILDPRSKGYYGIYNRSK